MFGQYFEKYCKIQLAANKSENTLKSEHYLHKYLWKFLEKSGFKGEHELSIKKDDVLKYAEYVNSSNLSDNTKHDRIKGLRPFYMEAVKQDWILSNPMLGIKPKRKNDVIPRAISIKEMKMLLSIPDLSTVVGIRDRTMFELLYGCALRKSELLSLTLDSFFDDYSKVKVLGKGKKEAILPVSRMSVHFLSFYMKEIWPKLNKQKGEHLFVSLLDGRPLKSSALDYNLKKYSKKAGLKIVFPVHGFRYSAATHLAEEGADIRYIQEYLRHDWLHTTARYIKQSFHQLQTIHQKTHPRSKNEHNR